MFYGLEKNTNNPLLPSSFPTVMPTTRAYIPDNTAVHDSLHAAAQTSPADNHAHTAPFGEHCHMEAHTDRLLHDIHLCGYHCPC